VTDSRLLIAGLLALVATPALGRDGALDPGMRNPLLPAAYSTATLRFSVEASHGKVWREVAAERVTSSSPITLPATPKTRFVRLVFPQGADILEWNSPNR